MWVFDLLGEIWDALVSIDDGADPKPSIATCEIYVDKVNMRTHKFERSIIEGKVKYNKPLVTDEMIELKKLTNKKIKATLPGPYLITRSMWLPALSKQYYDSKDSLGEDIIKVLKEEIDSLAKIGIDVIQFDEPVLTEVVFSEGKTRSFMCAALSEKKDPTEELKFATKLIKSVIDYAKEKEILVSLHVCRGNWSRDESILLTGPYTPLLPLFEETLPNILTLEFSTPRAGEISSLFSSTLIRNNCILGLGVMNPRTDDIEPLEDILDRVEEVMQYIPKERIWLNPDCGFATFANRPVSTMEIIDKKLSRLNEAKNTLRNLYD